MEQMLLSLDLTSADDEELNAIVRCAHSVKGGAATFGFTDVAELTHQMETLLDKLRRHELEPHPSMVDVLLAAGDALKAQLARLGVQMKPFGDALSGLDLIVSILTPILSSRSAKFGNWNSTPIEPTSEVCWAMMWSPAIAVM